MSTIEVTSRPITIEDRETQQQTTAYIYEYPGIIIESGKRAMGNLLLNTHTQFVPFIEDPNAFDPPSEEQLSILNDCSAIAGTIRLADSLAFAELKPFVQQFDNYCAQSGDSGKRLANYVAYWTVIDTTQRESGWKTVITEEEYARQVRAEDNLLEEGEEEFQISWGNNDVLGIGELSEDFRERIKSTILGYASQTTHTEDLRMVLNIAETLSYGEAYPTVYFAGKNGIESLRKAVEANGNVDNPEEKNRIVERMKQIEEGME